MFRLNKELVWEIAVQVSNMTHNISLVRFSKIRIFIGTNTGMSL